MTLARPPAPAGSDWSRATERSNRFALRLMSWIAVRCGRRMARAVLVPITLYFLAFAPGPRRQSGRFLQRALGRRVTWRDRWRHVHRFASTVLDRVYFLRDGAGRFDLDVSGSQHLRASLSSGQGAFLVGAHLGSFEALSAAGRQVPGQRIAMVMYPDNARLIGATLEAIAPGVPVHIIALGRRGSMLEIRDWLDSGGLVGVLADRTLPGSTERDSRVTLPFLGVDARFSDGPFRLAQLLRRPVIFMAGLYNGGRSYRVLFEPLADFSERIADPAERERRLQSAVQAYATRLEALCRESPYNWFNFHDFWDEDRA